MITRNNRDTFADVKKREESKDPRSPEEFERFKIKVRSLLIHKNAFPGSEEE